MFSKYRWLIVAIVCSILGLVGCGGNNSPSFAPNTSRLSGVIASVAVTPANQTVAVGTLTQFQATAVLTNGITINATTEVNWTSSNTAVATISNSSGSNGQSTAVAPGTTTITATDPITGIVASTSLTVSTATVQKLSVTPATQTVGIGLTTSFTATATLSDGTASNDTNTVTWSSSNTAVATINSAGVATGVATGTVTITATLGPTTATATLTVSGTTITGLTVTPVIATNAPLTARQFHAIAALSDGTTKDVTTQVTWTSNNNDVAFTGNGTNSGLAFVGSSVVPPAIAATVTAALAQSSGALTATGTLDVADYFVVASSFSGVVDSYAASTNATVTLTAVPQAIPTATPSALPSPAGTASVSGATSPVVSPDGQFVYALSNTSTIETLSLAGTSGALADVNLFTLNNPGVSLSENVGGSALYVVSTDTTSNTTTITPISVAATSEFPSAALAAPPTVSQGSSGFIGSNLAFDPLGRWAYIGNTEFDSTTNVNAMVGYTVNADGTLTPLTTTITDPTDLNGFANVEKTLMSPDGKFLYAVSLEDPANDGNEAILTFSIDQTTGSLTLLSSIVNPDPHHFRDAVLDPAGQYLYFLHFNGSFDDLLGFSVTDGVLQLQPSGHVHFGLTGNTDDIAVDASGLLLSAVGESNGEIDFYAIDPTQLLLDNSSTRLTLSSAAAAPLGPLNTMTQSP